MNTKRARARIGEQTVKDRILELLYSKESPMRYTDIMNQIERPDKTVYVTLNDLKTRRLVTTDEKRLYSLTSQGRLFHRRNQLFSNLEKSLNQSDEDTRVKALEGKGGLFLWMPEITFRKLQQHSKENGEPMWKFARTTLENVMTPKTPSGHVVREANPID
jgi:DNA-binding PadR family transcriptional regulator